MREARISGGRPQIVVEANYGRLPIVDLVVRNVTGGSARDINFEFSAPIDYSGGFVISDLRYYKDGMDFLGPGEHIACVWDRLGGESYQTEWRINPCCTRATTPSPASNARIWKDSY